MERISTTIKKQLFSYFESSKEKPSKETINEWVHDEGYSDITFEKLEKLIWLDFHEQTIAIIERTEGYESYSVREKILSFLYTLIEQLSDGNGYLQYKRTATFTDNKGSLELMQKSFIEYVTGWLNQGFETGEVINRMIIADKYKNLIWFEVLFIIKFWIEDRSNDKEHTDGAIEKSTNFLMDNLGTTPIDSGIDLLKFLFQKAEPHFKDQQEKFKNIFKQK